MRFPFAIGLSLCLFGAAPAVAQNSVFGVHGIGFPGRPISARARALGGGAALFDARSALNPASVAVLGPLVVTASSATSLRNYNALDSVVSGLSETRFPFALIGTRVRSLPFSIALSYSGYAERSYDLATTDSVTIRGETMQVVDQVTSRGAVADVRGAVGWRVIPRVNLGAAFHVLSGSVRRGARRFFVSDGYYDMEQSSRISLSGTGVSFGALITPIPQLNIAATYRTDTELAASIDDAELSSIELPTSYSAGLFLLLHPSIRIASTYESFLWSSANADLEAVGGANAFDTYAVGTGVELGGSSSTPLRLGTRYATLPFSPSSEQASELVLSAGSALSFADGRASLEATVERIMRDGAGAEERAWYLVFALTVLP